MKEKLFIKGVIEIEYGDMVTEIKRLSEYIGKLTNEEIKAFNDET